MGLGFLLGLVLLHHCACFSCRQTDILFPRRWLLHQQHMAKPTRQAAPHTTHSVSAHVFSLKDEICTTYRKAYYPVQNLPARIHPELQRGKHQEVYRLMNVLYIHLLLL